MPAGPLLAARCMPAARAQAARAQAARAQAARAQAVRAQAGPQRSPQTMLAGLQPAAHGTSRGCHRTPAVQVVHRR